MMSTFQLALCSMFSMARTHDVKDQSESDLVYQKLYLTLFDQYNSMLPSVFAKRELFVYGIADYGEHCCGHASVASSSSGDYTIYCGDADKKRSALMSGIPTQRVDIGGIDENAKTGLEQQSDVLGKLYYPAERASDA
ncbi:hypothetical protein RB195_002144 [Necator americanus]|uniref:Sema domain-containing protein n=1 Tax=Necator americanus TaxID=51031 RepID=A0ABR1DHL6_NECAM